jgi:protein arginine kinase
MIESLIQHERAELTQNTLATGPVLLSTRIRLARNLAGHRFPGRASRSELKSIAAKCSSNLAELNALQGASVFEIGALSELERRVLIERHLVSRELCERPEHSLVVISADQSIAVMVNEEDHLRIQVLRSGLHLRRAWRKMDMLDNALEGCLDFAFSQEFGYLTACPTNLGTGLRASAMMHLPALIIAGHMEKVIRGVNQLGLTVRGLFGEGSEAIGHIFQISNQQTLGESEDAILTRLDKVIKTIRDHELNARLQLLEKNPQKLFDQMGRAFGILSQAHVIHSTEAMNLLSLLRLAVDFGALPDDWRSLMDRMFIECQPGHVQFFGGRDYAPEQRDLARASRLREELARVPPLDFDKCTNIA